MDKDLVKILKDLRDTYTIDRYNQIVLVGHQTTHIPDYSKKSNQFVVASRDRIQQLRNIAKLMCIADVLNGEIDWRPEYGETAYYIDDNKDIIIGDTEKIMNGYPFKTMELAQEAINILEND